MSGQYAFQIGPSANCKTRDLGERNDETKSDLKKGEISEDQGRDLRGEIQKLTDGYVERIDDLLQAKEKEIMAI